MPARIPAEFPGKGVKPQKSHPEQQGFFANSEAFKDQGTVIRKLAFSAVVFLIILLVDAASQTVTSPFESASPPAPLGRIDQLVLNRLKQLDIQPANLCSDAVFLRRAYLDIIGTLPTPQEARLFLSDRDPNRRRGRI